MKEFRSLQKLRVSVPLRGNGRESASTILGALYLMAIVSVPLRGNGRERLS